MSKLNIGIMGLGSVGKEVAMKLSNTGFNVAGWSRSKKSMNSITSFYGDDQLNQFLKNTNILVCILPLTRKTFGILNNKVFSKLPKNSYVINVARGQHLVEQDILDALNKKQLAGACLDVFTHEPLPKDHLFWQHPNIIITPHVACIPNPELVAHQIIENYNRIQRGEAVLNQIDPRKEY
ncbi:NAD(P)-dependent oxidoreductase [Piscirickettsia salmonis]|uniref:NAD(P)-dependent oxidoreductase n=1 Tax=Piscirickettsia salmonis TaxID=1238 RepID=UPI0026A0DBE9